VNRSPLIDSAVEVLRQGEAFLNALDDESYTRKVPAVFTSAMGGHYRHCLDHFQCLLEGVAQGEVNYDHRQRDARIENDRCFALAETQRIQEACEKIPPLALELPLNVYSKVNYGGKNAPVSTSSFGRELMYAVAHAIHHYALIAVMCALLGVRVPFRFGIAPSTLQDQAGLQKAA
jgi:uncharacterized damage-inducible protein DinB